MSALSCSRPEPSRTAPIHGIQVAMRQLTRSAATRYGGASSAGDRRRRRIRGRRPDLACEMLFGQQRAVLGAPHDRQQIGHRGLLLDLLLEEPLQELLALEVDIIAG